MVRMCLIAVCLLLIVSVAAVAAAISGEELSLSGLNPGATWLSTHQRMCFGVGGKDLDEVIKDGTNVICGGTNAAGIGFSGGPFILDKDGKTIIEISGKVVPEQTLKELRANVDAAHAKNAKVLGEVIRFNMAPWMSDDHPDWQEIVKPNGKPLTGKAAIGMFPMGCWNSPYGDWFIKSQVEIVKRLDWDGYNMDGFGCWTQCYCSYCRESYKTETGKDIPKDKNVNDPNFRHYLKWRLARYTQFIYKWTSAMKSVKSDFVCAPWTTGPGRWWHWMGAPFAEGTDALHRVLDAPFLELLWDFPPDQGNNMIASFVVRYYRGLTGDRPAWMLPYLCEQGQFGMQPPKVECDVREMTVLTNGCLVGQGLWQQNAETPLSHFNKMIEEREPFTTGAKSLKWAAMLVGESSRLLHGVPGARLEVPLGSWIGSGVDTPDISKLPPGERRIPTHMESAVGVFRAMMEDHLPLDIVIEQDVESIKTLRKYKVLILPDATCLSQKAVDAISAFVKGGGGLVGLHESSICNEFGDRQPDFGLAGIYGAHFKGTEDYSARWPNYVKCVDLFMGYDKHQIIDDPVINSNYRRGGDRLNYIGWATNVEVDKTATVLGTRLGPNSWPVMVLNSVEKGRSAYIAADLGQAYFLAPYQYERRMITNAVRWAAAENQSPVKVEAPLCVQAAFYTQNDGKRTVVHLLNEMNTSAGRALPENNPPQREDTVPVRNIVVTLTGTNAGSAFQEPGHIALQVYPVANGVQVTVPEVAIHSMVVFE